MADSERRMGTDSALAGMALFENHSGTGFLNSTVV